MSETDPCTLKDRVVVVTGAGRGIGAAIAVRAAVDGAKVALSAQDRNPQLEDRRTLGEAADSPPPAARRSWPTRLTHSLPRARTGHVDTDAEMLREEGVSNLARDRLAEREEDLAPNFCLPSTPPPTA